MGAELIEGQQLVDALLRLLPVNQKIPNSPVIKTAKIAASSSIVADLCTAMQLQEPLLWKGNWQKTPLGIVGYSSQSEADMALCGALARYAVFVGVTKDMLTDAIMQAFANSGLYRPEKHNTVEKYAIPKAIANASQCTSVPIQKNTSPAYVPKLLAAGGYVQIPLTPPPVRDLVAIGMVKGHSYVLTSFGGVGKTQLAIQLACEIARGGVLADDKLKQGNVLSIHSEDDLAEIYRRAGAWAITSNYDALSNAHINLHWQAYGLVGVDVRLVTKTHKELEQTGFVKEIIDTANAQAANTNQKVRLIILDHAGLMHGGDFNDKADVALFMRMVNQIAVETGAAVLVLAHSPKSAAGKEESDASMIAGNTAFVDMARGAFVLATMRKEEANKYGYNDDTRHGFASLVTVKNNLGPSNVVRWFKRTSVQDWEVGVLEHAVLSVPPKPVKGGGTTQQLIKAFIKTHPGQFSKTGLRNTYAGKDGIFKASKGEVDAALDELLARGEVLLREPTQDEKKTFGHRKSIQVLEVKS